MGQRSALGHKFSMMKGPLALLHGLPYTMQPPNSGPFPWNLPFIPIREDLPFALPWWRGTWPPS